MRLLVAAGVVWACATAHAEPLPSGAIGIFTGAVSGAGADAKRIGAGYYQIGAQASWQPTTTEQRVGWTLRWATMFGALYGGSAQHIEPSLHTLQMDLTIGVRLRPWTTVTRYLTLRGGGEILRSNEPIPNSDPMSTGHRAFVGGIASIGIDQYVGTVMFDIDLRYGMIGGSGPAELALILGVAFAGP
jgi:hypothetical protein